MHQINQQSREPKPGATLALPSGFLLGRGHIKSGFSFAGPSQAKLYGPPYHPSSPYPKSSITVSKLEKLNSFSEENP
jgi:hypothetical protein